MNIFSRVSLCRYLAAFLLLVPLLPHPVSQSAGGIAASAPATSVAAVVVSAAPPHVVNLPVTAQK